MGYEGERSNPLGADTFIEMITEEDREFLRERVKDIIDELVESLDPYEDIKTFTHKLNAKIISVSVDGGNQPLFGDMPAIGMELLRVSSSSNELKKAPEDMYYIVRYRNLMPVLDEEDDKLNKRIEAELQAFFDNEVIKRFSDLTGVTRDDIGLSYKRNPQAFVGMVRDVAEWAYIVGLVEDYHDLFEVIIVKDGRLEQHGVNHSFVEKLTNYFETKQAQIVGVLKHTALLSGGNGISPLVIAEWVSHLDEEFYFRVPNRLMKYVYKNERQWNPEEVTTEGRPMKSFVFGRRYIGRYFAKVFNPLDSVFAMDIPHYFEDEEMQVRDIIGTIIHNRSLLFGGSFAPSVEAHANASVSDDVRRLVEDYLRQESQNKWLQRWI
jgi:hypothetical protein